MPSCFSHNRLSVTLWTEPTRLLCPWDSPGKNIVMGCISSARGSSWLGNGTHISYVSCIGRQILYHFTTWETQDSDWSLGNQVLSILQTGSSTCMCAFFFVCVCVLFWFCCVLFCFYLRQLFWPEHFAGMHTFDYIVLVSHKTAFTDLQFDIHSPDYVEGVSNNTDL